MTILSESFFTLMGSDFLALTLTSTWHKTLPHL